MSCTTTLAWAKDHVGYAEDENEEVDPRHEEPPSSAVANLSGIMTGRSGQFGEPTPFGDQKGSADRAGGHDCSDSDHEPRLGPGVALTRHQDDAGDEEDNCSRTKEGLADHFGIDGESIHHRIRSCSAHVSGHDLEGQGRADPRSRCEDVQGQQELIDAHSAAR